MISRNNWSSPPAQASCKGIAPTSSVTSNEAPLSNRSYMEKKRYYMVYNSNTNSNMRPITKWRKRTAWGNWPARKAGSHINSWDGEQCPHLPLAHRYSHPEHLRQSLVRERTQESHTSHRDCISKSNENEQIHVIYIILTSIRILRSLPVLDVLVISLVWS